MNQLTRLVKAIQSDEDFSEQALWTYFEKVAEEKIVESKLQEVLSLDTCRARARGILVKIARDCTDVDYEKLQLKFESYLYRELCNARTAVLANEKGVSINEFMKMLTFTTHPSAEAWYHLGEAEDLKDSLTKIQQRIKDHEDVAKTVLTKIMRDTLLRWKDLKGKDVVIIDISTKKAYKRTVKTDRWIDTYAQIPATISEIFIMDEKEYSSYFSSYFRKEYSLEEY